VARSSPKAAKRLCVRCAGDEIEPGVKVQAPTARQHADIEAYFKSRTN
jgi:hypothetical protein